MNQIVEWIERTLGLRPEFQEDLLQTVLIILGLWLLQRLSLNLTHQRIKNPRLRYQWRRIFGYAIAVLGVFLVGSLWFEGFQDITTFLGLLSAGLAIALGDLVTNLVGWFFILWRRPFNLGDRIQVGETMGDVIDIRLFQFSLMEIGNWVAADQSTGRVMHIPNGKVFREFVANYSNFGCIWNELPILITFESNWEKAKALLQAIALKHGENQNQTAAHCFQEASDRFMVVAPITTPAVYTSLEESGVLLTIRYLCHPRRRRDSSQAIWEDVLRMVAQNPDIQFAYPTQRFYLQPLEHPPWPPVADPGAPRGTGDR